MITNERKAMNSLVDKDKTLSKFILDLPRSKTSNGIGYNFLYYLQGQEQHVLSRNSAKILD